MKHLLITLVILLPLTLVLAEDLPTFELPEPTDTTAHIASAGGSVVVQLSIPYEISGKSYAAYELAELTFEQSEEPQAVTITFEATDNKKVYIGGAIVAARFTGFVSYGRRLK